MNTKKRAKNNILLSAKRWRLIFVTILLAIAAVGCGSEIKGISHGSAYQWFDISIVPPSGWSIEEKHNLVASDLCFYSPHKTEAHIDIQRMRLSEKGRGLPEDYAIKAFKAGLIKGSKGQVRIVSEGEALFNGIPAIHLSYQTTFRYGEVIEFYKNNHKYAIKYWVRTNNRLSDNHTAIAESLKSLQFK